MRKPGKKIDVWQFKLAGGVVVQVDARMGTDRDGKTVFLVHEPAYGLQDRDADINALRRRVGEHLKSTIAIAWAKYYLIEFSGPVTWLDLAEIRKERDGEEEEEDDDQREEWSARSVVSYRLIEIGTLPDGSVRWREQGSAWSKDGMPETGSGRRSSNYYAHDYADTQKSLVPVTPQTTEALRNIRLAFYRLNEKLRAFLHPDMIEKNLVAIPAVLGLPTPKKGK